MTESKSFIVFGILIGTSALFTACTAKTSFETKNLGLVTGENPSPANTATPGPRGPSVADTGDAGPGLARGVTEEMEFCLAATGQYVCNAAAVRTAVIAILEE